MREPARTLRVCPGCGYRGEGVPYFRRATHAVLLAGATVLTYGVGGLVYWLVKRGELVCPSCGISWKRSRPLGAALPGGNGAAGEEADLPAAPGTPPAPAEDVKLPSAGGVRRTIGVLLAILATVFLVIGIVEVEAGAAVASLLFGLTGAASFAWGWKARQGRREAILRGLHRRVLHLARREGGRLTATDVASTLDLSLDGAERVLLSLDDGFRVRSDVTPEGLLVFEFLEISLAPEKGGREPVPPPRVEPGTPEA